GAVGVILVRDRRPKQRHDAVADKLGDSPFVALHRADDRLNAAVHDVVEVLGIELRGDAREVEDVGQKHGDLFPLAVLWHGWNGGAVGGGSRGGALRGRNGRGAVDDRRARDSRGARHHRGARNGRRTRSGGWAWNGRRTGHRRGVAGGRSTQNRWRVWNAR